ncbi:acyltransferase [Mycobacterium bohemicum DSM 44277]|uniref:Acyltransferase n=1 Tax=Mycobacterium bohemicum DSM 44277 TaxID=1236609 RepID=A0A0U0W4X7_MYCBE|nr:acyltransferase [Mycobacterium bohemicum]CPR08085.1 acyltransferase [Mycobacterium bohemicum DSM 44277]
MRRADSVSPTEEVRRKHPPQKEFRPDIEGLRAVAVVAVVLFHAHVPGLSGGLVGVDVFFIISGFLITGLLWREASTTGTVGLRRFYGARARRLLPASATVGVVIMLGAAALSPVLQSRSVFYDGIASALYVSNYRFMLQGVDYLADALPSPFLHYWSLGVEEQFYLVWPALIIGTAWVIRHTRRRAGALAAPSERPYLIVLALVAALSFALSLVFTRAVPPVAFFSLPTRAWELAVGGLVALTAGQWRRLPALAAVIAGCAGLGLILLACVRLGPATPYPGTAALLPVLGAAVVIGAGCAAPAQGIGRVLAMRPMRALGRVSYSWYLWHWPLLQVVPPSATHTLWVRLTEVLLSLGLAFFTLRFIENPVRFAAPLRRSANRSLAVGGAATTIAAAVGVALLVWMPVPVGRGPAAPALTVTAATPPTGSSVEAYDAAVQHVFAEVQAAVAASVGLKAIPSNLTPPLAGVTAEVKALYLDGCLRNLFEVGQPECASGEPASTTTVALVGDSDAAMWNPAFVEVAKQRHWRLETMTKAACPMLDLPTINGAVDRAYTECDQWRGQITARLQTERPRLVVLSMRRAYRQSGITSYDPAWIDALNRLVKKLRGSGAQVLVLGPIPDPQSIVPDCLADHLADATACTPPTSKAVNQIGIAAEAAATKAGGAQYSDLTELFCTPDRCPVIVGNSLVYLDEAHLTREYSRQLAPVMGALADRTLASG